MNEYVDAILAFDIDALFALVRQVIDNPLSNVQASLLLLIAVVVVTLLAIVVAILVIGFGNDNEDDRTAGGRVGAAARPRGVPARAPRQSRPPRQPRPPLTRAERRARLAGTVAVTIASLVAAWVLAGITTGTDTMCLSCHRSDMPHTDRLAEEPADPHAKTGCVRCHEPGGVTGSLTYSVPSRVAHFAQGIAGAEDVRGYGAPVASAACARCHRGDVRETATVEERGVRISHVEPLEAGAVCLDCHEMQTVTGVVGTFTVGMAPCLRCHDNEQVSAECDYCHTKDIAYAVNVNIEPQPKPLVPDKRCGSCHDQTSCDACHGIRMPHTAEFIASEHPRAATLDIWNNGGRTCKKCHTETRNPCTACHKKLGPGHPVTHWPRIHGLGGPEAGQNRAACLGCHGYLVGVQGRNFCGVCHPEYDGYAQERQNR